MNMKMTSLLRQDSVNINVFLGGTVNGSTWRDSLVEKLDKTITVFNPVVKDWTSEDQRREEQAKVTSEVCLYVFTPLQTGYYAPVEAAVSAVTNPNFETIIAFIAEDQGISFDEHQQASNESIKKLILSINPEIKIFITDGQVNVLEQIAAYLNIRFAASSEQ